MALEQFKTQVLLLHSQQSVLESLSAGFDNRYTVYLATSGSEALSTLGDTPIQIIVTAQDLPGMSGLEALREAKRRSPDMIGILLVGTDTEAVVGAEQVFQVVQGTTSPEELFRIVDSAARQMRMTTISESANDNEAENNAFLETVPKLKPKAVEYTGQHIVMETMDNGASVMNDGTNRMFALDPEQANDGAAEAGLNVDVLVLSRDEDFLNTLRASASGLHHVHHAVTAQQALDIVSKQKVGVLVTDAAIAGNQVATLMRQLRAEAPRLVGIVAGRRDDGESLMELINRGHIYRFLLKPLSPGRARLAIEASAKYHRDAPEAAFHIRDQATPLPSDTADRPAIPAAPVQPPVLTNEPEAVVADHDIGFLSNVEDVDLPTTDPRLEAVSNSSQGFSKTLLGGAAVVAALLAVGAWIFLGEPADDKIPSAGVDKPATIPAADTGSSGEQAVPAYLPLLDNARFARDTGRVLEPAGDNAIEWYLEARLAAPDNVIVRDELAALIDEVVGKAEVALLENRKRDAAAALSMVKLADPENPRLAFISAQLAQTELHETLDEARAAIRDARFEDASRLLSRAVGVPGANLAAIDLLTEDLAVARSEQRVDDVLLLANERLASGLLTSPPNDNARYYFELAASNAPENTSAHQGLLIVASKLVLSARASIDSGDLEAAAIFLEDARALDPDSPEMLSTQVALQNALDPQAETETDAARSGESFVAAEPVTRNDSVVDLQSSAVDPAIAPLASDRTDIATAPADSDSANVIAEPAQTDIELTNNASSKAEDTETRGTTQTPAISRVANNANVGATDPAMTNANPAPAGVAETDISPTRNLKLEAAAIGNDTDNELQVETANTSAIKDADTSSSSPSVNRASQVAISELIRTNYVAPRYPRNAQRRGLSGWVEVGFTVTENGNVDDIQVMNSKPRKVFNDAATKAVAKWRFEPAIENGRRVARRVAVRMSFDLE